jgi:O-antigen/teichoic acid export membrane protein
MNRRLSQNAAVLLINNLAGAGLSFLLSALIGRVLGADGLGVYAAVAAWIFPLSLVVDFGLSMLMTRDLAAQPEQSTPMLRRVMLLRILIGGAVMLALIILAPLLTSDPQVVAGLRIAAPMVIILPMFSAFTSVFKAHGHMQPILWLNVGMLTAQVALTAAAFASGSGVIVAIILNVVTSAGQLAAAWLCWRIRYRTVQHSAEILSPPLAGLKPLLRAAYPFALAALFVALQLRLSLILLERLTPVEQVGYYAAASRFVEAARLIPNALFGALLPALAGLALNRPLLEKTFRTSQRGLAVFGIVAGIGFTLTAPLLLTFVYADSFAPASPVLIILGWSLLFSLLRGGKTLYWYALKRDHFVNRANALTLIIQIVLAVWLIPAYSANGAALASLVAELFGFIILWREWSFPRWRSTVHKSDHDPLHQP